MCSLALGPMHRHLAELADVNRWKKEENGLHGLHKAATSVLLSLSMWPWPTDPADYSKELSGDRG